MAEVKTEQRGIMNKMRRNTIVVMWILVISFVGMIVFSWGMDLLGFRTPPQKGIIGIVNNQEIEYKFFASRLQNEIERYRTQMGTVPQSQFIRNLNENLWNEIVNTILFQEAINDYNIMVTDNEIIQEIRYRPLPEFRSDPQFQKEDGTFDQAKYEAALRADNTGVVLSLEQQMRQVIPQRKLQNLILSTVRVTEQEIRQAFSEEEQTVKIEYVALDRDNFADSVNEPTEQEIRNYYQNNRDSFLEPETRQLKYVLFPTIPTNEDSAETDRIFREVHRRALQGDDFSELATEFSMGPNADSGGLLGTFGRGTMLKDIEDALFNPGVTKGTVIGPIETNFGKQLFYIERVVKSGSQIDSVQARNLLSRYEASETTAAEAEGNADYFAVVAQDEGYDSAVEELGYEVFETAPFAKGGFIPGFGVNREISDFANYSEYNESKPPVSNAIETLQGYAVFMLNSVVEERIKEMDEVRDEIILILEEQKMLQLAGEKMREIKQSIISGTSFQDAASQNTLEINPVEEYKFNDYLPDIGRNIKFASAAFALEPGGISNPIEGMQAVFLVRMIEKQPFDEERYTEVKADIKNRLLQGKRMSVFNTWIMKLRDKADIEDYRNFFYRLY